MKRERPDLLKPIELFGTRGVWRELKAGDAAVTHATWSPRVARVEENTAADRIELSAEQIERLNNLTPAAGERHDEGNMAVIDR